MKFKEKFLGKNIFISGGTSGIGLAIGKMFASLGASVFAFSVDNEEQRNKALEEMSTLKMNNSQKFEAIELDIINKELVEEKIDAACKEFGIPFVVVNSAGIGGAVVFEDMPFERFDKTIKLNLYGTRHVIHTCLQYMKSEGGFIINVSSMSGLIGLYGYTAYSSSKFAVVGFTQALRSELKKYDIQVSVLCPVQVETPLLKETDQYKPPETKAINNKAGVMTADEVAWGMLKGMEKNQSVIIPGKKGQMFYLFNRMFPGVRERMTERIISKTRKSLGMK